jgi:hypothetical protein
MAFSFFTHKQKKQAQLSKTLIKGSKFLKWNEVSWKWWNHQKQNRTELN